MNKEIKEGDKIKIVTENAIEYLQGKEDRFKFKCVYGIVSGLSFGPSNRIRGYNVYLIDYKGNKVTSVYLYPDEIEKID